MILLRITLARIILRADIVLLDLADRLLPSAASLAPAAHASEASPALNPVERRMPAARARPAGLEPSARASAAGTMLLASIIGMAICALWIAITWRAS